MLFVAAVTFAISYLFSLRGIDPQHEGFLFKTALDVSRGMALYRDTFTQYGSLPIYAFALGIRLFGETVVAINAVTCLVYAASGVLLYALVRRFADALVAVFAPLLAIGMAAFYFWNFHPWPSVFAMGFSLAAALAMVRFIDSGKSLPVFLCGVMTAAMFWCRQPQGLSVLAGVFVLVGLLLIGCLDRRAFLRALLWYAAGNLALHAVLLAVVLIQGAFADWWTQVIVNAFAFAFTPDSGTIATNSGSVWKTVFVGLDVNPQIDFVWRVLTYGTLLSFLIWVALAFSKKGRGRGGRFSGEEALLGLIAFAAFSLFNWPHYYPTLCYRHVFWSDYPMFGVLCVALYRLFARVLSRVKKDTARRALCAAVTIVLMTGLCANNLLLRAQIGKSRLVGGGHGANFHAGEYAEEDTTLRYTNARYGYLNGLFLSPREVRFYDALFRALFELQEQYPDKNVVNLTDNALFSVFGQENPHKRAFDNDPREFHYPEQMDVTNAYIAQYKPIVIASEPLAGYDVYAYIDEYNGDVWRYRPFYVLTPLE